MGISELFRCSCRCSCGLCCSKDVLCPNCEIATLKANGIPVEYAGEISGLKYKSSSHGNSFEFSELYYKLNEIGNRLLSEAAHHFK